MTFSKCYRMYDSFSAGFKELEVWSDRESLGENLAEALKTSGAFFDKSPCVIVESPVRNHKKVQVSRDALYDETVWKQVAKQLAMAEDNYSFAMFAPSKPDYPRVTFGASEETFTETLQHNISRNDHLRGTNIIIECTSSDLIGRSQLVTPDEVASPNLFKRIIQ